MVVSGPRWPAAAAGDKVGPSGGESGEGESGTGELGDMRCWKREKEEPDGEGSDSCAKECTEESAGGREGERVEPGDAICQLEQ